MKKTFRTFIAGACLSVMTVGTGFSQIGDIGIILSGGVEDAEKMLTEYLRPLANSLGANLNGGWYNTAKVHGTLGFDITFSVSTAFAPDDSKLYDHRKFNCFWGWCLRKQWYDNRLSNS